MSARLLLGISTCPNDTFAFHGLLTGAVDARGLELDFELRDVEELNQGLLAGRYDAAKASFHAALAASQGHVVLPAGAALGFGVGPLVLAGHEREGDGPPLVLCPGEHTTATLLWRLFHPQPARVEQVRFSEILPALERGEADLGVCIHEARFTFQGRGLRLVEDLGARWERETNAPLPLGGILARRSLGADLTARLSAAIRDSIDHGHAHREAALATMRVHAQEQADEVLWKHVELYVDEETRELSREGRRALQRLHERAAAAGLVPASLPPLEVASFPRPPG